MRLKYLILIPIICALAYPDSEEVSNYLNHIRIGRPLTYQNLRIFPLNLTRTLDRTRYITLDEGIKHGYLKIKETGSGSVNEVQVKNISNHKIFLMTGEVIVGAKQDRMIKEDILLPPNSEWISLPVYCTEHGRWTEVSKEFKTEELAAPGALRQRAKVSESQSEVWEEIAGAQSRLRVSAPTQALKDVYRAPEVKKQTDPYIRKFASLPHLSNSTIGVVVTVGDRIVCIDLFANHTLLSKLWEKLLKSYALDAIQAEKASVTEAEIEEFLKDLEDGDFEQKDTPGLGRLFRIDTEDGIGSVLVYRDAVVHLDLFPKTGTIKTDPEMNLDFRRQERR